MKVGIIGGAGYTAGELVRLLINHPQAELAFVQSSSHAGALISDVHQDLTGDIDLRFVETADLDSVDVLFMCSGHGVSRAFWQEHELPEHLKVIDLAQDYRDESDGYVYGLPEANRERIQGARLVANPGCYATAIQLALLPLAKAGLLPANVQITGITGSTGAGVKPSNGTHFSWRSNNLSVYKPFVHQHLAEITRTLQQAQAGYAGRLSFIPVRGDFARGIYVMCVMQCDKDVEDLRELYAATYANAAFTHFVDKPVDLKMAVNTNKAMVTIEKHEDQLLVVCAIDNLLKGASGQALQNMNLMCGCDETTGLRLKSQAF